MKTFLATILFLSIGTSFAMGAFPKNVEDKTHQALMDQLAKEYAQVLKLEVKFTDMDPGSEYYFNAKWEAQKSDQSIEKCQGLIAINGNDFKNTLIVLDKNCQ